MKTASALVALAVMTTLPGSGLASRQPGRDPAAQGRAGGTPAARLSQEARIVSYGPDRLQRIDFYPARAGGQAPLVVFVHGGGWKRGDKAMMRGSDKLADWQAKGYAVASLNYRLVPTVRVEDQARDIAAALAALRRQAQILGFDRGRMVLMGHSAGAHLVALVGTDPQWLRGAGLDFGAVAGIVALDGAGYDVPAQMAENSQLMGDTYVQAFGTDLGRQRALSPTRHAAAPNSPAFLILHVDRADAKRQSEGLAQALRRTGTPVSLHSIAGRGLAGHMEINRRLGDPSYQATGIVDGWLGRIFAR